MVHDADYKLHIRACGVLHSNKVVAESIDNNEGIFLCPQQNFLLTSLFNF
jgi:hypothetical protein